MRTYARKDTLLCLRNSKAFRRFSKAFSKVTGMQVFLLQVSSIDDLLEAIHTTHPICRLIARSPKACERCRISIVACVNAANKSGREVFTCKCPFGLWRSVVPIKGGPNPVFLYTGRVLLNRHGQAQKFPETYLGYLGHFVAPSMIRLSRHAASQIQVLSPRIYAADIDILRLLSRQMKLMAPRLKIVGKKASIESPFVQRAKELINERHGESLHLDQIASQLHVNRHYLSHMFHDQTGLTFTEYLTQTRFKTFEKLLMESKHTVTEAAFAAGFQSLSQANRVFLAQTGQSPQAFRKSIFS